MRSSVSVAALRSISLPADRFNMQYDPIDRPGLEAPLAIINKDGVWQCKKHGSAGASLISYIRRTSSAHIGKSACNQCYGWKKQIQRARVVI